QTGESLATLQGHAGGVNAVAFRPDGRLLASGGEDGLLCLRDLGATDRPVSRKGHRGGINALAFAPDGGLLASAGGFYNAPAEVLLWDADTIQQRGRLVGHSNE